VANTGIAPFNGYISKTLIKEGLYDINLIKNLIAVVNYGTLLSLKEAPVSMSAAMIIMALVCLFTGLMPGLLLNNTVLPYISINFWSISKLWSNTLTLAAGLLIFYFARKVLRPKYKVINDIDYFYRLPESLSYMVFYIFNGYCVINYIIWGEA